MDDPPVRPRGVRVRTACVSEAEFIKAFQDVVDESTLFAPTERLKPVGAECAFSLELADGTAMLRGLGLIVEAWPNVDSPFGRPGMRIEIDKLTPSSQVIIEKLVNARAAEAARKPRQRPHPSTYQLWALTPPAPRTEEMGVPDVDVDEPGAEELPRTITRELRSVGPRDDRETVQPDPDIEPTLEATRSGTARGPAVPARLPRSISAPVASPPPSTAVMSPSSAFVESSLDSSDALAPSRPRPWWMNARIGGVFAAGLLLGIMISLAVRSGHGTKSTAVASEHESEPASRPAAVTVASAPNKEEPIPSASPAVEPCRAAPTKSTAIATTTEAAPTTKSTAVATKPAPTTKSSEEPPEPATTTKSSTVAPTKSTAKLAVASNRAPLKKRKKKVAVRCTSLDCL